MLKKHISLSIYFIFLMFMVGCASNKRLSETDQYKEMREATIYRAYQKISIESMRPIVKEYNKKLTKENKPQAGDVHVHSLLALIWLGAYQPKYALAESQYAVEHAIKPKDRFAALAVQALAMHEQGWHGLATQTSNKSNTIREKNNFSRRYKNSLLLVHVAGGALAVKEGDITQTIITVNEIGLLLNKQWIVKLAQSTQSVHRGAITKAIAILDEIKSDPSVSNKTRKRISKMQEIVKGGGKNMTNEFGKAVINTVAQEAVQDNDLTPKILAKLPKKYRTKITKYINR